MLTCDRNTVRLPQNDLAYAAFRLALLDAVTDLEIQDDDDEEIEPPIGYLKVVPYLEQVPLPVQVDLLAETWARHFTPDPIEASLLDAAIVYAACQTADWIIHDMPQVALGWLSDGPRKVPPKIIKRASHRLEDLYDEFWDDQDFLLIDEFQDLPPERARHAKEKLDIPEEYFEPIYAALERWNVSPNVAANLIGLMTEAEIQGTAALLTARVRRGPRRRR